MALALCCEGALEEVLGVVREGLQWLGGGQAGAVPPSKSASSQARTRWGPEVMAELAQRVLRPLARPGAPGAWCRGWRLMAVDGTCMDLADEAANAQHFGHPAASRGQSAFPQARVLGLVECGTHAVVAAAIAPYGRSEVAMAAEWLPPRLTPDRLVMADRNFYCFKLWQKACASGAKPSRNQGVCCWRTSRGWDELNIDQRFIVIPKEREKTRKGRQVPLSTKALGILAELKKRRVIGEPRVFATLPAVSSVLGRGFKRITKRAECADLHFHDLRHEAVARFFERTTLQTMEIALITGHSELKTLQRYANLRRAILASKLDGAGMPNKMLRASNKAIQANN